LALNNHGFPSNDHIFRIGENASGEQRPQVSLQPQTKIGSTSGSLSCSMPYVISASVTSDGVQPKKYAGPASIARGNARVS
jgi:hypothetical protein